MPQRIQRKRTKGWRLPENTVSITRPGRYGNPYIIGEPRITPTGEVWYISEKDCLKLFEQYAKNRIEEEPDWLDPIRGKDLTCFCKEGAPCHGDILLRLANT